ncbi:hypothetical protein FRC08_006127 [Ceratobasidium sp. 394]|nr:hypothetical protein FRC08_006127 [Ceratobasidium sp. 394]
MRRHILPPGTPESVLEAEADRFELEIVASARRSRSIGQPGIIYLPGAEKILAHALAANPPAPRHSWAVCTSATLAYASSALGTVGIPIPPYLSLLEIPKDCVVFEDALSGIKSGKAAGCKVIPVLTSHSREAIEAAEPDVIVEDLTHVTTTWDGNKFVLAIV